MPPRFPNRGTHTHLRPNPQDRNAPHQFSPHGRCRRRGSLYYKRTGSLAEVAELPGDSKRVAADDYLYALTNFREVDRSIAAIAGSAGNRVPANPCIDAQGIWGPISNNGK